MRALATALFVLGTAAASGLYDVSADFSTAANPSLSGMWSYGWKDKLDGPLQLYTRHFDTLYWGARVAGWSINGEGPENGDRCCPFVARNEASRPIVAHTAVIPIAQFWFHPGPHGEYSVVRWNSPGPGRYRLTVRFDGFGVATSDVHIIKNNIVLGEEELGENGSSHDFFFESLELVSRDHLDFVVGYGANHNYYADITGLTVTIRDVSSK